MKNNFFIFVCVLLITSCTECEERFEFDGSEKYFISGVISDENGNPLANVPLSVNSTWIDSYAETSEGLTNSTVTDQNGYYSCIFTGANTDLRIIAVNSVALRDLYQLETDSILQMKEVLISTDDSQDYELVLNATLSPAVNLNLINNTEFNYSCDISHDGRIDQEGNPYPLLGLRVFNNIEYVTSLRVPLNSQVTLSYSDQAEWIDTTLVIGLESYDYEF